MDQEEVRPPLGDFYYENNYLLDAIELNGAHVEEALDTLKNSERALDIGAGSGMSTIALANLMPNLSEITTVDSHVGISPQVEQMLISKGITLNQIPTTIQEYLEGLEEGRHFPVIMARGVKSSGLNTSHISKLGLLVPQNGLILSLGDTRLPEDPLIEAGMSIVVRTGASETVWIKKR